MSNPVLDAYARIRNFIHRTPVLTSRTLDRESGNRIFLKCENMQRAGAFKIRGASNAVSQLTPEEKQRGVVTHSSGNHAQALALAARMFEIKCRVVMPNNAPAVKREATRGYGAEIIPCEPTLDSRLATVQRVVDETGAVLIPPYDDDRIIAGQGTAALELLEEVPDLDYILVPVGGGGLISGTALAAQLAPRPPKIIGCEPAAADDAYRSFKSGQRVERHTPRTIADGLTVTLSARTFAIIREYVEDIVLVSEQEILDAMRFLWERVKIVVEPSGAVSLAPALFHKLNLTDQRIGVILSGGNVDLTECFALFQKKLQF